MSAPDLRINGEEERLARDRIKRHPLTPELSAELFAQMRIGAFRSSAALIEWSQSELEGLQKIWVQAYQNAWHVPEEDTLGVFRLGRVKSDKTLGTK